MPWIDVLPDDAVPPGAVRGAEIVVDGAAADAFPDEVVVWRTADGRLVACDARCPHQWSHLAAEGAVDGDELVCCSHFWRFTVTGVGTKVNVGGRRDAKADLPTFPVQVRDGRIEVDWPRAGRGSTVGDP